MGVDLALFDFDGTITSRDTFVMFARYATSRRRWVYGNVVLAPRVVGYHLRCVAGADIRERIARAAFGGVPVAELTRLGSKFAEAVIPRLVRERARDAVRWHLARGDRVVIVSASLDVYLAPWCRSHGLELICTQLEARHGTFTGSYAGGDCSGGTKRERVLENYRLSEYRHVHAYGDTDDDLAMLDLADTRYLRWRSFER